MQTQVQHSRRRKTCTEWQKPTRLSATSDSDRFSRIEEDCSLRAVLFLCADEVDEVEEVVEVDEVDEGDEKRRGFFIPPVKYGLLLMKVHTALQGELT